MAKFVYHELVSYGWNLKVVPERWSDELWRRILAEIRRQSPQRHPQTVALNVSEKGQRQSLFLKVYYPGPGWSRVKDWYRVSKAVRFLNQGVSLADAGFLVPSVIATGEQRRFGSLRKAFVLTLGIDGVPLPVFLSEHHRGGSVALSVAEKRTGLRSLARQIRRLHDLGFVHGDLVPSNIFVRRDPAAGLQFYFMDNDRTRRYPLWLRQKFWKRNLVQLNRFPLASVSLQDRIRFFQAYSEAQGSTELDRPLLRWLERKTRQRRRQCDSVDSTGDYRKLMSWRQNSSKTDQNEKLV